MIDNSNIIERKGKNGLTLQIQIKYGKPRKTFTRSIKVSDFPDKKSAYVVARMIRDKARIDIQNEKIQDVKVPTLEWFFNKHLELGGYSLKTKERHASVYKTALIDFKDIPLNKIKTADIQESLVKYASNHSQGQLKRAISLWHTIYQTAIMMEYDISDKTIALNKIKSKVISKKRNTDISQESFEEFCEALLSYNLQNGNPNKVSLDIYHMLQIMRYSGCRIAEVLALNKDDYDPENHILHINKSVGSNGSQMRQIITTKTLESVRDIPCSEKLDKAMQELIKYSDSSPLLLASDKKPYEIDYISNYIHLVSLKCGIQFNAYMLRHLFSTSLFRSGVNQAVIRDLMGHAKESMSLGYANTSQDDRKKAIELIDK